MIRKCSLIVIISLFSANLLANTEHSYHSKYAGQEKRAIKSLSQDDIQQLNQGKGWGLAKAAELNGMPGPVHILEMKQEINLTESQEKQVIQLYNEMKAKAIPLGKKLIELEKKLNTSFAEKSIDDKSLNKQLNDIALIRSKLRYVHLATHLKTPSILTSHQVTMYNRLRGYNSGDPCENVPKGHDEAMWKKHNNCK